VFKEIYTLYKMVSDGKKGIKLFKGGECAAALPLLESAHRADAGDAKVSYWYGNALVMTGKDIAEGIKVLEGCLSSCKSKHRGSVNYAIGYGWMRLKQPRKAEEPLAEAVRIYKAGGRREELEMAKALNRLAEAKLSSDVAASGRLIEESLAVLRKAKASSTVHVRALFVKAQLFRKQRLYEDATSEAKEALRVAESMKHRDTILIREISEFLAEGTGWSLKIPMGVCAVVCMVGAAGAAVAM